jgi:hypothetical protein
MQKIIALHIHDAVSSKPVSGLFINKNQFLTDSIPGDANGSL